MSYYKLLVKQYEDTKFQLGGDLCLAVIFIHGIRASLFIKGKPEKRSHKVVHMTHLSIPFANLPAT